MIQIANRTCPGEESNRLTQRGCHGETGGVLNVFDLFRDCSFAMLFSRQRTSFCAH